MRPLPHGKYEVTVKRGAFDEQSMFWLSEMEKPAVPGRLAFLMETLVIVIPIGGHIGRARVKSMSI